MKSLYDECIALGLEADSEEAVYVFAESVLYLIGATGAFDFQKHIKPLCHTRSAKRFRLRLCEHRYTHLSLKLYVLHLAISGAGMQRARTLARECEIQSRDARLVWMLMQKNEWFSKSVRTYVRKKPYSEGDLSQAEIQATFNRIFPSVFKYIKHITYKKLRFLVKSNNTDFADFHSELSAKVVQSFYSKVPTQMSDAHLTNYLKRTVHNHAVNLIKSGTTQKRGRMVSTEADANGNRQFSMLCMSQNQMALTESGEQPDVDGTDESAKLFELRFSISEVLDGLKLHSRKYRFLTLLLGSEDKEFSDWLRVRGLCNQSEDNVDVQHRLGPNDYTRLVSDFLCVSKQNVDSFLQSLRSQLAW